MEITLSIEELVYCFYSEGLFEQGAGLKQTYFEGLSDEQMDLLFQAACRSLLSKDYLTYEQHRFSLRKEIAAVISALNFSSLSLKVSKFLKGGEQDTISIHFSDEGTYCHSLLYEGQVHVFEAIEREEVNDFISGYLEVAGCPVAEEIVVSISQAEFETMLSLLDESPAQVSAYLQKVGGTGDSVQKLAEDMILNSGYMNSILFLQFNGKRDPVLSDILFLIKGESNSWLISRVKGNRYVIHACNQTRLSAAIQNSVEAISPALH